MASIRAGPRTLLADALEVTDDEFVGYERLEEGRAPRNDRLRRKLREIEWLDEADRRAILRFVDALLAEQRFAHSRGRLQRAARPARSGERCHRSSRPTRRRVPSGAGPHPGLRWMIHLLHLSYT